MSDEQQSVVVVVVGEIANGALSEPEIWRQKSWREKGNLAVKDRLQNPAEFLWVAEFLQGRASSSLKFAGSA